MNDILPWILGAIVVLILAVVFYFISTYNGFVRMNNQVQEAFSTMDVYLVKRYDLIPNLVETVKGYASHESETLEAVVKARNIGLQAGNIDEKVENADAFSGVLSRLLAITENYPDLKANTNFMDLQKQLQMIEGEIANARKYYNGVVKLYNTKVESIPSNIVASVAKFKKHRMFEVKEEAQRENVKVSF
ncbi:MAG: LemA family protein [Erysipelotrichaceae bacterium]